MSQCVESGIHEFQKIPSVVHVYVAHGIPEFVAIYLSVSLKAKLNLYVRTSFPSTDIGEGTASESVDGKTRGCSVEQASQSGANTTQDMCKFTWLMTPPVC